MNVRKTICTIAITLLGQWASGLHAEILTLKDTRTYAPYTSEVSGPEGCAMPKNLDKPNLKDPNECRVKRSQRIVSGELLSRDTERALCTFKVFSSNKTGNVKGLDVPDLDERTETFKCSPTGERESQ